MSREMKQHQTSNSSLCVYILSILEDISHEADTKIFKIISHVLNWIYNFF